MTKLLPSEVPAPVEFSPALGSIPTIRHGFFGRRGGISTGEFASLNVSESGGDDAMRVIENRGIAANALGYSPVHLQTLRQVHSNIVHVLRTPLRMDERPEADALVTALPGALLGIITADCAPILLADAEAAVIGAAHAGWKGAISGVLAATVAAMTELGAQPQRIIAAIGPTISMANYEVGPEFATALLAQHPAADRHIRSPKGEREHFDLPGFVEDQLAALGISTVDRVGSCTYAEPKRYFSHRFATHHGERTGRQIALIGLVGSRLDGFRPSSGNIDFEDI